MNNTVLVVSALACFVVAAVVLKTTWSGGKQRKQSGYRPNAKAITAAGGWKPAQVAVSDPFGRAAPTTPTTPPPPARRDAGPPPCPVPQAGPPPVPVQAERFTRRPPVIG
jgi:hypothetical protein